MPRTAPRPSPSLAVGYVRVSTDEQHLGPEAQRAAIVAYAEREGLSIVAWEADLGVSGAAAIDDRPGLQAALARIEAGEAGALIVAKRDRLARDVMLAAMVERLCDRAGARIVAADGAGNGEGPEAALMRAMINAFAAYERELIRARTRAALAAKRARGERAGTIPAGYTADADGRLAADPREQEAIALARAWHDEGLSLRKIAARLADAGRYNRAGRPYAAESVARLLAAA